MRLDKPRWTGKWTYSGYAYPIVNGFFRRKLSREKAPSRGAIKELRKRYKASLPQVVNKMEVVRRHILKRIDGVPVDIRYNPVRDISRAVRLTPELFEQLMTGHFKPEDREQYYLQEIEIQYREVNENERDDESVPKD